MTGRTRQTGDDRVSDLGFRVSGRSGSSPRGSRSSPQCRVPSPGRSAFTLIELLVVIAIMVMLLVVVGAAWRSITDTNVEAKAINLLSAYASVARAYAMRHQLETVLTVDPNTGQLELWVWDTEGVRNEDGTYAILPNSRYAYAPVLDETARLPRKGGSLSENLAVRIAPIDYDNGTPGEPADDWRFEALARFALCFDPQGRLVVKDFTLLYDVGNPATPIPIPPPLYGRRVVGLRPGHDLTGIPLASGVTGYQFAWFYIRSSRGGIAYVPPEGRQAYSVPPVFLTPADMGDPETIRGRAISQTPFMFNQYTGRAMLKEEQQ